MLSLSQNYLTRGFWGDEAWTSLISQLPYLQMLKTTAADFHPPAYYTIVELVYKVLPPTEMVTRSISLIFYFLTILAVYKLASHGISTSEESKPTSEVYRGKGFGLISALVVAVNPIFFTYAFEARNYTMFAFAATASIYFLIKLSSAHPRGAQSSTLAHPGGGIVDSAMFVFFTTLGIYTHYYMFFIIFAQGMYLLLFDRKLILKMIAPYFLVGILYLPWIPFLYKQLTSVSESYWISPIGSRTHWEALMRILAGESQNPFQMILFRISGALLVVGLVQHALRHKFEKPYLLIWLWATVPFVLASLPGLAVDGFKFPFRPIFFWRYLIGSSVPLSMVIVHSLQKFPKQVAYLGIAIIVALSIAIDFLTLSRYPYTFREAYREHVLGDIQAEDKIVTVLPSFAEVLYYRNRNGLSNELVVLPEGIVQFSGKSLLDAYVTNGTVAIDESPEGSYFELAPGPIVEVRSKN